MADVLRMPPHPLITWQSDNGLEKNGPYQLARLIATDKGVANSKRVYFE